MTFWHDRWKNQLTGWHRAEYNDLMVKHWPSLNAPDGSEVLVPLCGKSLDMLWLAEQGYSVVGMDMVEQAVQTFFTENELSIRIYERLENYDLLQSCVNNPLI